MYKIIGYELKKSISQADPASSLSVFVSSSMPLQLLYRIKTPNADGYSMLELSETYEAYAGGGKTSSYFEHEIERKTQPMDADFFRWDYTGVRMLEHLWEQALTLEGYEAF